MKINIEDYNGQIVFCKNKHRLCFVNSGNRIKHFRHIINDNYNNLWHKSIQEEFDNIEVYYQILLEMPIFYVIIKLLNYNIHQLVKKK